eukprot:scaffold198557_cov48-Attheya_sp.AAC.3
MSHMFGFRDEDTIKTDEVKVILKVKDHARKARTAKKRGVEKVMMKKYPEKSPNNDSNKQVVAETPQPFYFEGARSSIEIMYQRQQKNDHIRLIQ